MIKIEEYINDEIKIMHTRPEHAAGLAALQYIVSSLIVISSVIDLTVIVRQA